MDSLFDQGADLPVGDDARPDTSTEQPEGTPKPVSPLTEQEWLSIFQNPKLRGILRGLASFHYQGSNSTKRRDMVQASLEKLQKIALKKKAKSPAAHFNPIDHARHAFFRVRRELRAEKRRFFDRMRQLSSLLDSGAANPKTRPSDQSHQAQVAYDIAFRKFNDGHQRILTVWRTPGTKLTYQEIGDICGCSKGTVTNVLKRLERLMHEIINDFPLC